MENIIFTLNTVLPVFIIIFIGTFLRHIKIIDADFISTASKLVFKIALPALVFIKVSNANLKELAVLNEILFAAVYLLITFILCMICGFLFIRDKRQIGVFAQAVFRGNYGIVGLALLFNMLGDPGLAKGAIILAIASPLYNILGTIGLIIPQEKLTLHGLKKILIKIISNPIIIALLLSFIVLIIKWFVPGFIMFSFVERTLDNLANMSLPVALIAIGGSLSLDHIRKNKILVLVTTILRLIISPLIFTLLAVYLGFRGPGLAALYMLFGVPTAVASFIFAKTMEGDADLAANVIVTTTLGSVLTVSVGVYLLKVSGLI